MPRFDCRLLLDATLPDRPFLYLAPPPPPRRRRDTDKPSLARRYDSTRLRVQRA
jgi:hypothetical protein